MTKHGLQKSPEYACWERIKTRCYNPKSDSWPHYGGRGITVCGRWKHCFQNFYSDMGPRPSDKHSIERIDNDGNYDPSNCKWGTRIEQANNNSRNTILEFAGERKSIAQWAEQLGVNPQLFYGRHREGWSDDRIITTKARKYSPPPP